MSKPFGQKAASDKIHCVSTSALQASCGKGQPFCRPTTSQSKLNYCNESHTLAPGLQLNVVSPVTFPSSTRWPLLAWQAARVTGVPITSFVTHSRRVTHPPSQLWNKPMFLTHGRCLQSLAWHYQEKQLDGADWARCWLVQYWTCTSQYKEVGREEHL